MIEPAHITKLLVEMKSGDDCARRELFEITYRTLRSIAGGIDDKNDATKLVHEAYIRLAQIEISAEDRRQFFSLAATVMHRIVIDEFRRDSSSKREGAHTHVPYQDSISRSSPRADRRKEIALAIAEVSDTDPDVAHVLVLSVYGGLTRKAIAQLNATSEAEVVRSLRIAKDLVRRQLKSSRHPDFLGIEIEQ